MPDQQRYLLKLHGAEPERRDLMTLMFASDDTAMLGMMTGFLEPLLAVYPKGELWTDDRELIWRKGPLDA